MSEPKKESQVSIEKDQLGAELNSIHDAIETLISRLETVLSQPIPDVSGTTKVAQDGESLVPLAQDIRLQRRTARNARAKIQDLLDRLEL